MISLEEIKKMPDFLPESEINNLLNVVLDSFSTDQSSLLIKLKLLFEFMERQLNNYKPLNSMVESGIAEFIDINLRFETLDEADYFVSLIGNWKLVKFYSIIKYEQINNPDINIRNACGDLFKDFFLE